VVLLAIAMAASLVAARAEVVGSDWEDHGNVTFDTRVLGCSTLTEAMNPTRITECSWWSANSNPAILKIRQLEDGRTALCVNNLYFVGPSLPAKISCDWVIPSPMQIKQIELR
jgi:hypothetical protein